METSTSVHLALDGLTAEASDNGRLSFRSKLTYKSGVQSLAFDDGWHGESTTFFVVVAAVKGSAGFCHNFSKQSVFAFWARRNQTKRRLLGITFGHLAFGHVGLTAVGDDKQRIMIRAGARPDGFIRFQEDFAATSISLLFNYKSSPELVKIQHVVARALESNAPLAVAQTQAAISEHAAQIWSFHEQNSEAAELARWIASEMQARSLRPRDFAILVRQTAESLENSWKTALPRRGWIY